MFLIYRNHYYRNRRYDNCSAKIIQLFDIHKIFINKILLESIFKFKILKISIGVW